MHADQVDNPKINIKSPARARKERESVSTVVSYPQHQSKETAISDQEVKNLKEKLLAAESRERILSQHLLDNQTEMAELQLQHEKDMTSVRNSAAAHGDSAKQVSLLRDLVSSTTSSMLDLSSGTNLDDEPSEYKQQLLETFAVQKSCLDSISREEKV